MSYKIEDDYGVTEGRAQFSARPGDVPKAAAEPRPLFDPPQFPLVLPNARTRNGVARPSRLERNPYAGAEVDADAETARRGRQVGRRRAVHMRLPERLFTKPLARALIEQRRILALDANQNSQVYTALDALMIAPELFTPEAGITSPFSVAHQLEAARTDGPCAMSLPASGRSRSPSRTATSPTSTRRWRAAPDALKQAWARRQRRGRSRSSRQSARGARQFFLRQLAEQLRNTPAVGAPARSQYPHAEPAGSEEHARPHGAECRVRRQGGRAAAVEQLQQSWRTCRWRSPASPATATWSSAQRARRHDPQSSKQLRDKTFRQGQDSRRDRMRGKQGDQSMGDLQQDQQALRDRLQELQRSLRSAAWARSARRKGPARRTRHAGSARRAGDGEDGLGEADSAMGDASGRLGEGQPMARWIRKRQRWKRCARAPRASRRACSRATATARWMVRAIARAAAGLARNSDRWPAPART